MFCWDPDPRLRNLGLSTLGIEAFFHFVDLRLPTSKVRVETLGSEHRGGFCLVILTFQTPNFQCRHNKVEIGVFCSWL